MSSVNWQVEHERFMTVAYNRTLKSAKRAFHGWHPRKQDDAVQECLGKMWDSWSRLLIRGRDPEPMTSGLIKYAILWVRYDRKLGGRARRLDVFDYRAGLTQQQIGDHGHATPTDRSDPNNGWINWTLESGDNPADLASALETTGVTLNQWCDC